MKLSKTKRKSERKITEFLCKSRRETQNDADLKVILENNLTDKRQYFEVSLKSFCLPLVCFPFCD